MRKQAGIALAIIILAAGFQPARAETRLRSTYAVYAAGFDFIAAEARMAIGHAGYQLDVRYHTVGVLGALYPGHQHNVVTGAWSGSTATPHRYHGVGRWRGRDYVSLIEYESGRPEIRALLPVTDRERETVPEVMRLGAIDALSALADLIAHVGRTDRCDTSTRLFDGRRATEVSARTVSREVLAPTSRSSFAGPALRCAFEARVLAGFRATDDAEQRARPFVGSAWFARVLPDAMPVPVHITFETRSLGSARMYLTGIAPDTDLRAAAAVSDVAPAGSRAVPSR